ncbi:MAG TPA: hypothetical protein VNH64_12060, partial [Parvularculaceae bacterium]|nr:hypothetical protein [Parvularculaceae bacterium]
MSLQFDIAEGAPLSFSQKDVGFEGCAIEARLYAEDPSAGFLPQTGRITLFDVPSFPSLPLAGEGPGEREQSVGHFASAATLTPNPSPANGRGGLSVRVDAGVEAGDEVSAHYDPMIAKLIAYGETR